MRVIQVVNIYYDDKGGQKIQSSTNFKYQRMKKYTNKINISLKLQHMLLKVFCTTLFSQLAFVVRVLYRSPNKLRKN